jgi:hypothetical protein
VWQPANSSAQPPNTVTLFIAQAWHELLNPQTPDTFQARVLDLPMLIDELSGVAELAREDERWSNYLPAIAAEIKDNRQQEAPYLARDSRLASAIDAVIATIDSDTRSPNVLRERSQIALTLLGDVQARWQKHALELAAGDGHQKQLLLHRLSTLATHVLDRGLEEESLAKIHGDNCRGTPAPFVESATGCTSAGPRNYTCLLALYGSRSDLAALIANSKFTQVGKGAGIRHDETSKHWHQEYGDLFFVSFPCSAVSRRMAAEQSLQAISTLLNVQNLYHNSADFRAGARVLVYDQNYSAFSVEVSPEKHFGLFPRSEYRRLSRETYARVGHRLDGRISNALECHALALSADHPKTAIINLWTALETITGFLGAKATGARVADCIAPIIARRRVDKIATYLALSVHSMAQWDGRGIDSTFLPASSEKFVAPDDILRAVTGKANNPAVEYLLQRSAEYPLLVNRLFTVWQQFHDPKALAGSLAQSRKRVEWQISRIYRARNLLVHRGDQSRYTWRLLRNAHYYVSSTISRVLHDLRDQPRWTVDTSLVHQQQRYDYLHDQLFSKQGATIVFSDLLLQKTRNSDTKVWA